MNWPLVAALALGAAACSSEVKGPEPASEPASASADPPPVDPEIICRDQLRTEVTLNGSGFSPVPIDIPGDPKVALPDVLLSRGHGLDGSKVGKPQRVLWSGDPDADDTNAFDDEGDPLLRWDSQKRMHIVVHQSLTLGTGDGKRDRGVLEEGVWDVRVENPNGSGADTKEALAVVGRPEIDALTPGLTCLAQGPRTVTLDGSRYLRNGEAQVQLAVEGADDRFDVSLSDCTEIDHKGLDAEVCDQAQVEFSEGALDNGLFALTLHNPETAACHTEEDVKLRVVPPPTIERVVPALACIAQGERAFVIEGSDFLRVDDGAPTVTVGSTEFTVDSMDGCQDRETQGHAVERCDAIMITIAEDALEPDLYAVTVENPQPAGCNATATGALRIVAPPVIERVDPSYVCLQDGGREVTVRGSGFLVVDGAPPAVEVAGEALDPDAIAATDCEADSLDVGDLSVTRCDGLVLSLGQDALAEGNPSVRVTNPDPAGCQDEASDLWTVLPRPTLASVVPQPICNEQGDDVLTLTGTGFLDFGGAAPSVTVGGVSATSVSIVDGSCEAVAGRDEGRLCSELSVTLAAGTVGAGLHDVVVTNTDPAGCVTEDTVTLAVVDAPEVAQVHPSPVCLAQGDVVITVSGQNFVRIGTEVPSVTVGDVTASAVAPTESTCTEVAGVSDTVSCTELTATLAMGALADDSVNAVTVKNPATADCSSEEAVDLTIVPPPTIASLDSAEVCTGGGTVTITGSNLSGVTAQLVDPDTQGVIEAVNTVVNEAGTSATITFGSGVQPDVYELVIAGASGCGATATDTVTGTLGPVAFFMDPPVAYNGIALRATVYASDVVSVPANVILTPAGGGTEADQTLLSDVSWPAGSDSKVGATIPADLAEGVYDVTLDFAGGCDAVLPTGLTVEADATTALLSPALDPPFGEAGTAVAVNVDAKATADLAAGEVNFEATPRVYLSSASLATAEPLRAVTFDTAARLTAIVPDTLPQGTYDLVVINPGGAVGFQAAAFEATAVAPPVIDDVTPTQLDNDIARDITISGSNFFNPSTDMSVTLECLASGGTSATTVGPLTLDGASTGTALIATVPSGISHGSICVVRVDNTTNNTYDEFSAITVTNPATKLPVFQAGTDLEEGRRAPASVIAAATREARFLYAIGGDDGDAANPTTTVEAAPFGRFGDVGQWRTIQTELPQGITQAQAIVGGRYVYLFGGLVQNAGTVPSDAILRAEVLDPAKAPVVTDVDLRFYSTPDSDPSTRDGLSPGAYTYVVAAVFDGSDDDNPVGESLPSEPLTLYAPDVPDGVEVELSWDAVLGADGITEAVTYRIYRTETADASVTTMRLLGEVSAPTRTFVDDNPSAFADAAKAPLSPGDLGAWATLPDTLNSARAAHGIAVANDPTCQSYLYLVGGYDDADSESATYEYATFDPLTGALGSFTEATGAGLDARRELAAFVASDDTSSLINPSSGCEAYLYASSGYSGSTSFVTTIQQAPVETGGALGTFATALSSGASPQQYAGHAAFFSSDGAYVMGGASGAVTPGATDVANQAAMDTPPTLGNFSSASNNLLQARYLPGFSRQGAFFYLVGGADSSGSAMTSTESNVR
ncbi:MAG: hypothetical protein OXT09_01445 [Myxococcales bacterium]|nr:hypothetical protein [Myxococcales bacterium]